MTKRLSFLPFVFFGIWLGDYLPPPHDGVTFAFDAMFGVAVWWLIERWLDWKDAALKGQDRG